MFYSVKDINGNEVRLVVRMEDSSDNGKSFILYRNNNDTETEAIVIDIENGSVSKIDILDKELAMSRGDRDYFKEAFVAKVDEAIADGEDFTEQVADSDSKQLTPYDPEKIRVEPKTFSLREITEMIDDEDLDLSPDFQRNFVWDNTRKSRLIESILLRIPIPVFYFSMDEKGVMHVVDGVQRLTTISQFMDGEFALQDLEYLKSLNGLRFTKVKKDRVNSNIYLDDKYSRRINATQISVNVIDSASPATVKYDIFRRINTGGRPLNAQEMRNCLMSKELRNTLKLMATSDDFKKTTGKSIPTLRMQAQELALRFISFREIAERDGGFDSYSGLMDQWLDEAADRLSKKSEEELSRFVDLFNLSMRNAAYLFGRHAFRKVNSKTTPTSYKTTINKALFLSWSVALSFFSEADIRSNFIENELINTLGRAIDEDKNLSYYLSVGTNGWKNLRYAYQEATDILNTVMLPTL